VFLVHMTSLLRSSVSCCRLERASRLRHVPRRQASFWSQIINSSPAAVTHEHHQHPQTVVTPEKLKELKQGLVGELYYETLPLRADLLQETLLKQGFWSSLRQALTEDPPEVPALTKAVQEVVDKNIEGNVAASLTDGTLAQDTVVEFLRKTVIDQLIINGTIRAKEDRWQRRTELEDYQVYPDSPEWFAYYKDHKQSEDALQTGVPDECLDDPWLHIGMMKFNRLKEMYNINTEEAENDFVQNFDISHGVLSLEAAFGPHAPIPEHTFEELPIIKEPEPETGGHEKGGHH